MKKILNIKEAIEMANRLKSKNKSIVLAGGFFDILHPGHIKFLRQAKKKGNYLFVLLEDDYSARKQKGEKRPINSQKYRAAILSSLKSVDHVIMLKKMTNDSQYDKLVSQIAPSVIAATYGDLYINHKKRQAKLVNGKVIYVTKRILTHSTTQLIKSI